MSASSPNAVTVSYTVVDHGPYNKPNNCSLQLSNIFWPDATSLTIETWDGSDGTCWAYGLANSEIVFCAEMPSAAASAFLDAVDKCTAEVLSATEASPADDGRYELDCGITNVVVVSGPKTPDPPGPKVAEQSAIAA